MTKAFDLSRDLRITQLARHTSSYRVTLADGVRRLFKPFGWTGSKPEKWGYLADPTGFYSQSLPFILVATIGEEVVASASLVRRDHADMDCGPWLAGLVVHPDLQQCGVASQLLRAIDEHAARLFATNHPDVAEGKIYLSTERTINSFDSVDMYARRGWKFLTEEDAHKSEDILMWKSI